MVGVTEKRDHRRSQSKIEERQAPAEGERQHVDPIRLDAQPMQQDRGADHREHHEDDARREQHQGIAEERARRLRFDGFDQLGAAPPLAITPSYSLRSVCATFSQAYCWTWSLPA